MSNNDRFDRLALRDFDGYARDDTWIRFRTRTRRDGSGHDDGKSRVVLSSYQAVPSPLSSSLLHTSIRRPFAFYGSQRENSPSRIEQRSEAETSDVFSHGWRIVELVSLPARY